jgi:hypothetical protein
VPEYGRIDRKVKAEEYSLNACRKEVATLMEALAFLNAWRTC